MNHFSKIAACLEGQGLDAVLLTEEANRFYASGFRSAGTDGIALVTRRGNYYFTDSRYTEAAERQVQDAQIREVGRGRGYLTLIREVLQRDGVARMGFDDAAMTVRDYHRYREGLPCELVPAAELLEGLRAQKDPEELEIMIAAQRIAERALAEALNDIRPGVTEKEMAQCFREDVMKSGFCVPSSWSMFSTGPSGARLTLPGDGVVKDGDVVKFDAGVNAEFDFYTTDTSRAWVIGNGDPALLKLKDRLYEGQRRMIAAAKPGLPINELYHTAYDYVKEMFPCYRRGHQGHSISLGPATAEAPYINATETRPLEAGMVLAMEVPCYIDGVNGFNIEDMVLITEDGCEVLTPNTPHYLR